MSALADLIGLSGEVILLHLAVFLRVAPAMALFPGLGEGHVPVRIRLVLALMLTAASAPALIPGQVGGPLGLPRAGWLMVTETAVGLLIGLGLRLFLVALQTTGAIAAQAMSLAQIAGAAGAEPMPAMGHLLVIGGLALAMTLGLHVRLTEMTILSYALFPPGGLPQAPAVAAWGVARVAGAFGLAFTLAAPFVLVSVLYNLTLGIINRAMPQLMVVLVGAPVITGAGLVMLLVLGPTMLRLWVTALEGFVAAPFGGG